MPLSLVSQIEPSVWAELIKSTPIGAAILVTVFLFLRALDKVVDRNAENMNKLSTDHAAAMGDIAVQLGRVTDRMDRAEFRSIGMVAPKRVE